MTHPNSYVAKNNLCVIENFKVCMTLECDTSYSGSTFLTKNSELIVDISKPLTQQTVYLTPITSGGVIKPLPIQILVCGNEVLEPRKSGAIINLLPFPITGFFEFQLSSLFTNSDFRCPINKFSLISESKGELTTDQKKSVTLIDNKQLKIDKSRPGDFNFYVKATSTGGVEAM